MFSTFLNKNDTAITSPDFHAWVGKWPTWTSSYGKPASLTFCFRLPNRATQLLVAAHPDFDASIRFGNVVNSQDQNLIKAGFDMWSRIANVVFTEVKNPEEACEIPIYKFRTSFSAGVLGLATISSRRNVHPIDAIGFNADYFDTNSPAKLETIIHEVGHILGEQNPLEEPESFPLKEKITRATSIMIRNKNNPHEYEDGRSIIAKGPTSIDMQAARYIVSSKVAEYFKCSNETASTLRTVASSSVFISQCWLSGVGLGRALVAATSSLAANTITRRLSNEYFSFWRRRPAPPNAESPRTLEEGIKKST